MEIETPVLLAYAIEDSTDIFRISGGGVKHPKPPSRYATGMDWIDLAQNRDRLRDFVNAVTNLRVP